VFSDHLEAAVFSFGTLHQPDEGVP